jgi:hypothetical protein
MKTQKPKNSLYQLLGENIGEHLKIMQDGDRATDWHFRTGSQFAKALEEHLLKSKEKDCIIDREGRTISCHRGTGYAVNIKNPTLHFAMPDEVQNLSFDLEVGYEPNEEDDEYRGRDIERSYHLYCPIDLELNFNKHKFDLWLIETRKRLQAEQLKQERKTLDRLLKRNADYAAEKLLKLKR